MPSLTNSSTSPAQSVDQDSGMGSSSYGFIDSNGRIPEISPGLNPWGFFPLLPELRGLITESSEPSSWRSPNKDFSPIQREILADFPWLKEELAASILVVSKEESNACTSVGPVEQSTDQVVWTQSMLELQAFQNSTNRSKEVQLVSTRQQQSPIRLRRPHGLEARAVEDADGAEDVPFDELVGMQGPVLHLLENAVTVLLSNAIFLGIVAFIPFTLGRIIISLFSKIIVATGSIGNLMRRSEVCLGVFGVNGISTIRGLSDSLLMVEQKDSKTSFFSMLTRVNSDDNATITVDAVIEDLVLAFKFSDASTVAIGYMAIFSAILFYLGLIALIRYSRGEPMTIGRI